MKGKYKSLFVILKWHWDVKTRISLERLVLVQRAAGAEGGVGGEEALDMGGMHTEEGDNQAKEGLITFHADKGRRDMKAGGKEKGKEQKRKEREKKKRKRRNPFKSSATLPL
jgi:hypothetical protein